MSENKDKLPRNKLSNASDTKFRILSFRLSIRLSDIIFPIDIRELADSLVRVGYAIPPRLPPASVRTLIHFGGEIARKEGIIVDANSEMGVLGITARSYDSAIDGYNELSSIIQKDLNINLDERSRFFEIIAEYKIESSKNPLKSVNSLMDKTKIVKDTKEIFEQETSIYSLRFVTKDKIPNQEEWLDVTIEPYLIKPMSTYCVSVVFRSAEKAKVLSFGKELEARLLRLVDTI